jgi:hypothetical protein
MTYKDLQKITISFEDQIAQAAKCYAIGDKYVADVQIAGMSRVHDGQEVQLFQLLVQLRLLEIFPADGDMTEGFEECELHDLPPAVLVKFAEIKGTVDAWKAGTMPDLPPSTHASPTHRRRPLRLHRRRM